MTSMDHEAPVSGVTDGSETVTAEDLAQKRGILSRYESVLLPVAAAIGILIAWEIYGRLGTISPLFFSYPTAIWGGFLVLWQTTLLEDLRVSGIEFAWGLAIGCTAIPLGMLIGSMRRLRIALDPIINALYSTPMLALTPLFVIWFGLGIASKIAIVAVMAFFPLLISAIEGVGTVDSILLRAVRSFGARRRDVYRDVVFPSIIPFLVSGFRLAIGRAIIGVVIGEFIGAVAGIGYRIRAMAAVFRTPEYLAGIAVLMVIAVVLNLMLKAVEGRVARWRVTTRD